MSLFLIICYWQIFARQFQDAASPSGRRLDLCVVCQNAVFLAERLIVNSKLHHRTCFRCARCTSQLSVANYYETEKGQYCCETCPDEVEQHKETAITSTSITTAVINDDDDMKNKSTSPPSLEPVLATVEQIPATLSDADALDQEQKNDDSPEAAPLSSSSSSSKEVEHLESQQSTIILPEPVSFTQQRTMELKKNFFQSLNEPTEDVDSQNVVADVVEVPKEEEPAEEGSIQNDEHVASQLSVPTIPEEVLEPLAEEIAVEVEAPDNSQVAHVPEDDVQVLDVSTCSVDDVKDVEVDEPETVPIESSIAEGTVVEESTADTTSQSVSEARDEPQSEIIAQVEEHRDADVTSSVEQSPDSSNVVPKPRRKGRRSTDDSAQIRVEKVSEYPEDLNPFEEEEEEEPAKSETTTGATTSPLNPFGSEDEGDESQEAKTEESQKKVVHAPRVSLNPFGSDDDDEEEEERSRRTSAAPKQPKPERPPLPSTVFNRTSSARSLGTYSPRKSDGVKSISTAPSPSPSKKRHAPPPPPLKSESKIATVSPTPQFASLRRKEKPAPPPPSPIPESDIAKSPDMNRSSVLSRSSRDSGTPSSVLSPTTDKSGSSPGDSTPTPAPRTSLSVSPMPKPRSLKPGSERNSFDSESDVVFREKSEKEMSNLTVQCNVNKDSHGQWKRKKGPAPPRPLPQKRQLRKLPVKMIQQQLEDIEVKQLELERQGVALEQNIRSITDPDDTGDRGSSSIEMEEQILQLFDLVNEKNELLRRQTELMYIRRQQRLEEEHAELEFQIRCLMEKPSGEKTDEDRLREEELIQRLVQVVHRRSEIVDCLEMDRRREVEEDQSIQQHLEVFNSRGATASVSPDSGTDGKPPKSKTLKMIQSPIKLIKKDKEKKSKKKVKDADKDIDESENEKSQAHSSASVPPTASASVQGHKEKDKDKKKSKLWFTKWFQLSPISIWLRMLLSPSLSV